MVKDTNSFIKINIDNKNNLQNNDSENEEYQGENQEIEGEEQ